MKIIIKLIVERILCIINDYSGKYSKILNYFKNSQYEDRIPFFILGRSFLKNPINLDIQYDINNAEYIKCMVDVLILPFQKDNNSIEAFEEVILKIDQTSNQTMVQDSLLKTLIRCLNGRKMHVKYLYEKLNNFFNAQSIYISNNS